MEKIKKPIALTTIYLFVYAFTCHFSSTTQIAILLFSLSPLPIIWMVLRVLKDGEASKLEFTERFYEDEDYKRIT